MAHMSSNDMMGQFRHHVHKSSGVPRHHRPSEVRQIPVFVGGFLSRAAPAEGSPAEEATESPAQESAEDAAAGGTTGT